MKKTVILLLFVLSCPLFSTSTSNEIVGTFITSIYDIDINNDSFKTVFWIWWKSPIDRIMESETISLNPQDRIEIVNAREFSLVKEYHDRYKDVTTGVEYYYTMAKFSATINHNWNTSRFPFDSQNPRIIIESVEYNSDQLIYTKDKVESLIDEDVKIKGWTIPDREVEIISENKNYKTNFGVENGDHNQQIYPRFTCSFNIKRDGTTVFYNYLTGYMIAFIICLFIFFIDASKIALRLSMAFAAFVTSFGSKILIDFNLPVSNELTIFSGIQFITFITIITVMGVSIVCNSFLKADNVRLSKRVNKVSGFVILLLHLELSVLLFVFI